MQLDCGRHVVAGTRADNHCRKCAARNGKKKGVDSKSEVTPSYDSSVPSPRAADHPVRADQVNGSSLPLEPDAVPVETSTEDELPPVASAPPTVAEPDATPLQEQWDGVYGSSYALAPGPPRAVNPSDAVISMRHLVFGADPAALEQFTRAWRRGVERAKAELLRADLLETLGMRGAA